MKSDEEIFEWICNKKSSEIELAKCRMLHAYHNYCSQVTDAWNKRTKGMSKLDKDILIEEMNLGNGDDQYSDMCSDIEGKIELKYDVDIEHEETSIHVSKFTKNFVISFWESLYNAEDKKLSDIEFEVELDGDAYFIVELFKFLEG